MAAEDLTSAHAQLGRLAGDLKMADSGRKFRTAHKFGGKSRKKKHVHRRKSRCPEPEDVSEPAGHGFEKCPPPKCERLVSKVENLSASARKLSLFSMYLKTGSIPAEKKCLRLYV